ncbi:MAG: hypothetical protein HDT40_09120 [Lachnospiraceae bacterium]|nr:hypothetical protein [Lachnospiraceae bacterium]
MGGNSCAVESEILYKALLSLPEKQRNVLLLDFWGNLSDREISERLEVTPRTVYNPKNATRYFHVENEYACFHTGQYTKRYRAIYACFDRNKRQVSMLD